LAQAILAQATLVHARATYRDSHAMANSATLL